MNKLVCTLVTASVLVSGAAYGQNKSKTAQPLRDNQMDKVTAGSSDPSSGAAGSIAANNSTVNTTTTGAVNLSGSALMGAAGVNIVHINTELRVAWRHGLEKGLAEHPDEVVPYKILPAAVEDVKNVVADRLRLFNDKRHLAQGT